MTSDPSKHHDDVTDINSSVNINSRIHCAVLVLAFIEFSMTGLQQEAWVSFRDPHMFILP